VRPTTSEMANPCRIAVVGAGPLVGAQHCRAAVASAELACVCQRRSDDRATAERFGVPLYTDAGRMAQEELLHGIVIAAPTHLHLPLVEQCLLGAQARQRELGEPELALKALLVEKPICESLAAATKLVALAEAAGVHVLVGHQRRHSAFVRRARELVTRADFGPLRGLSAEFALLKPEAYFQRDDPRLAWRSQKGAGGPVLINLIHDVDLLRFITGHEVSTVFASLSSSARQTDVEDTGAVTVVLDHGAVGTFFFSDAAPSPWSYEFTTQENAKYPALPGSDPKDCYHFFGAQRSLAFPSLRRFQYGQEVREPGWDAPLSVEESDVQKHDPITAQMEHFVRVCRREEMPVCSGHDAMESLAVILAVLRSAETQMPVRPGDLLKESVAQEGREDVVFDDAFEAKAPRFPMVGGSTGCPSSSASEREEQAPEGHEDTVFYNAFGVEAPLLPMSGSAEGEEQAAL